MMDLKVGDIVRHNHFGGIYAVSVIREYADGELMAGLKYLSKSYTGSGVGYTELFWLTEEIFVDKSWYRVKI